MQARLVPEDEAQVQRCLKMGIADVNKVLTLDDLVKGDDCMFTATAITNCNMLNGLRYFGDGVRTILFLPVTKPAPYVLLMLFTAWTAKYLLLSSDF